MSEDKNMFFEIEIEEEEEEVVVEEDKSTTEPIKETSSESEPPKEEAWQDIAGVDPKEFDSPQKLATAYKEARKGLSDQGVELKQYRESTQKIAPILQVINDDPELTKMVKSALEKRAGVKTDNSKTEEIPHDPRVDVLVSTKRDEIIGEVEDLFGISKMTEEQALKARRTVGQKIKEWNFDLSDSNSIQKVKTVLADAYVAAGYKQRDMSETPGNFGFGSLRSSGPSGATISPDSLSPEQKKAADGMRISYADYAKNLQEIS